MITIVDYGMGNLGSIQNMLLRLGHRSVVSGDPQVVAAADRLILPGVGAFDSAMRSLADLGLVDVLNHKVRHEGVPVLGICLGMQLLSRRSEEGVLPGFGWIEADTVRFQFPPDAGRLLVPHMGWNTVDAVQGCSILDDLPEDPRFYFVHSYHVRCDRPEDVLAVTHYGIEFASAVRSGNVMGTQFHPEKSHRYGLKLLQNYAEGHGC